MGAIFTAVLSQEVSLGSWVLFNKNIPLIIVKFPRISERDINMSFDCRRNCSQPGTVEWTVICLVNRGHGRFQACQHCRA